MKREWESDIKSLQDDFRAIVKKAFTAIRDVPVDIFVAGLSNLSLEHMAVHREFIEKMNLELRKDSTLINVWVRLTTYWNFLNYFLLEQVVIEHGTDDLRKAMKEYEEKVNKFRCRTRLSDFAKYFSKISSKEFKENLSLLKAKLDQRWDKCTLEDLDSFWRKIHAQVLCFEVCFSA